MVAAPSYYWPCDEGSGSTVDEKMTGAAADGAVGSAVSWATETIGTMSGRNVLKGAFQGSANSYVDAAVTAAGETSYSFQLWVKSDTTLVSDSTFFSTDASPTPSAYIHTISSSWTTSRFWWFNGCGGPNYPASTAWRHLVVTYPGHLIYVDGVVTAPTSGGCATISMPSGAMTFTLGNANPHSVAACLPTSPNPNAWYCEGALWLGTTLSGADVTTLYNSGTPLDLAPPAPPAAAAKPRTSWFF
jgi:hypothetical protein